MHELLYQQSLNEFNSKRREANTRYEERKCVRYISTISVGLNHSARKTSAAIEERSKFSVRTVLTFGNNGKELRLKSVVSYKNVTISKRIRCCRVLRAFGQLLNNISQHDPVIL